MSAFEQVIIFNSMLIVVFFSLRSYCCSQVVSIHCIVAVHIKVLVHKIRAAEHKERKQQQKTYKICYQGGNAINIHIKPFFTKTKKMFSIQLRNTTCDLPSIISPGNQLCSGLRVMSLIAYSLLLSLFLFLSYLPLSLSSL